MNKCVYAKREFRVLVENLTSGVALIDESGRFVTVNSAFMKLFGLPAGTDILNVNDQDWNAWQVFQEDGITLLNVDDHPVRRAMLTGKPVRGKLVGVRTPAGGDITWMIINAEPLLKPDGIVEYLVATYYDITERRKAEEALRESEAKASALIEHAPTGIYEIDFRTGKFVSLNDAVCSLTGYTREELFALGPSGLLDEESRNRFAARIRRSLAGESLDDSIEYRVRKKDGSILQVSLDVSFPKDRLYTAFVIGHDVTERKRSETELLRLNRELRAISECNQAIVRSTDEVTLSTDICRIMCDVVGYRMAWLGAVEHDETKSVCPVAWYGAESGYLASARITWADVELGRGATGIAARTGKTDFCQDFVTDPKGAPWRQEALARGFRSSIALPLLDRQGSVLAVFTLYAAEPNGFNPAEVRLLEELAGDLAFGIDVLRTRKDRVRAEAELAYLASFPELNPNPIVEADDAGSVKYINPAAKALFPDLATQGSRHPYFAGWQSLTARVMSEPTTVTTDVQVGSSWYAQDRELSPIQP